MKSKEKSKEEIVLIRYYNVLFYLVFKGGIDDFNRQCLVNRINTGESIRMKQIQKWCHYHQITYCLLYTSPSPRDRQKSRMPSSA